jgi:hypothetical protein
MLQNLQKRKGLNTLRMHCRPQEVGGTLIGEDGLVVIAGAEEVEWYQIHQTRGSIPFALFQPLL